MDWTLDLILDSSEPRVKLYLIPNRLTYRSNLS